MLPLPPMPLLLMVDLPNWLMGTVAGLAALSTLLAFGALVLVTRRPRNAWPDHTPPITVLKPLKGLDEGLEANLRSFFEQDYPAFQLLFGVADADDPAIGVVERLMAAYPQRDARLIVGTPPFGRNPKVENLAAMVPHRKHDVILISDSNVLASPRYLRETACYLADPGVGLVTNVFVGVGEQRLGAKLENLHLNGFIAGNLALASRLRITCVVGKSMLMPVRVLEAIGGLAATRNLLAEDQAMGVKIRKAGYRIQLSPHVIANVNQTRDVRWFLNRHARWLKIRFQMALPAFLVEPLGNLGAVGLLWALAGESAVAWGGLAVLWSLAMARDAVQTRWLRGTWPRPSTLIWSPIKDLLLLPIWLDALFDRSINWRGNRLLVGRFTRLRSARVPLAVRRRVRRVQRYRSRHPDEHGPG